jgi:hypothetical protein
MLVVAIMGFGYRSLFASERIIVTPYGTNHPQRGDFVEVRVPTQATGLMLLRIDAGPGDVVRLADLPGASPSRAETVPSGYYYSTQSSRLWSLVPEKYIVGKLEISRTILSR